MSADDIANNPAEAASPAAVEELAQPEGIATDTASEEQPLEGQADAETLIEVEYEGKTYKLPQELKDSLLRQADYTRKTQEAAEKAKALAAQEADLTEKVKSFQRHAREVGKLMALDDEIAAYEKVDWRTFSTAQPVECQQAWIAYQQKLRERDLTAQALHAQEQKWQVETQQETAKRLDEGRKAIAAQIPGWSTELEAKVSDHVASRGIPKEMWASVTHPGAWKIAHEAFLYRQLMDKQKAANPTPAPVAPIPQVGGQRAASPDLRTLASKDTDAFIKARNKQLARSR